MHLVKTGTVKLVLSLAFLFLLVFESNVGFCEDAAVIATLKVARYISITAPANLSFAEDLMPGVEKVHTLQFALQSSDHTNFSVTVANFTREYTDPSGNLTGEIGTVSTFFDIRLDGATLLSNADVAQVAALVMPVSIGAHTLEITFHATADLTNQAGPYTSSTTVHGEYSI